MTRALVLLSAFAALSACAGSAPVVEALPPQPVSVPRPASPPRPPPPPPPVAVVVPEAPPAPAPSAPRGTLESRAYYEPADVTEWILANGATVVFKPLATSSGLVALMAFERSTAGGDVHLMGNLQPPGRLADLFATPLIPAAEPTRPGASLATYVLVGNARAGDVERAAAEALVLGRGVVFADFPAQVAPGTRMYRTAVPPASDAVLAVLVEVLRTRAPTVASPDDVVGTTRDEGAGTSTLLIGRSVPALDGFRVAPDELAAAKARAGRAFTEDPSFWAVRLAQLYASPREPRPSRDPSALLGFPAQVARVSSQDVLDLAARFAASPVN